MRIAHVAVDLGARNQRGNGVDHDHVDRSATDQRLDDLECLLAGVRLRDQQISQVDPAALGVHRIERVLGIDVRRDTTKISALQR